MFKIAVFMFSVLHVIISGVNINEIFRLDNNFRNNLPDRQVGTGCEETGGNSVQDIAD